MNRDGTDIQELLYLYPDGQLSEEEKARVDQYLESHPEARKVIEDVEELQREIARPGPSAPDGFVDSVLRQLGERPASSRLGLRFGALATLAAACLVVGLWRPWMGPEVDEASPVRDTSERAVSDSTFGADTTTSRDKDLTGNQKRRVKDAQTVESDQDTVFKGAEEHEGVFDQDFDTADTGVIPPTTKSTSNPSPHRDGLRAEEDLEKQKKATDGSHEKREQDLVVGRGAGPPVREAAEGKVEPTEQEQESFDANAGVGGRGGRSKDDGRPANDSARDITREEGVAEEADSSMDRAGGTHLEEETATSKPFGGRGAGGRGAGGRGAFRGGTYDAEASAEVEASEENREVDGELEQQEGLGGFRRKGRRAVVHYSVSVVPEDPVEVAAGGGGGGGTVVGTGPGRFGGAGENRGRPADAEDAEVADGDDGAGAASQAVEIDAEDLPALIDALVQEGFDVFHSDDATIAEAPAVNRRINQRPESGAAPAGPGSPGPGAARGSPGGGSSNGAEVRGGGPDRPASRARAPAGSAGPTTGGAKTGVAGGVNQGRENGRGGASVPPGGATTPPGAPGAGRSAKTKAKEEDREGSTGTTTEAGGRPPREVLKNDPDDGDVRGETTVGAEPKKELRRGRERGLTQRLVVVLRAADTKDVERLRAVLDRLTKEAATESTEESEIDER